MKYIVFFADNQKIPQVDIWVTKGELTHSLYAKIHNINKDNISSVGYLNFNPSHQRWDLEHYTMTDNTIAPSLLQKWNQYKKQKRDRLLVRKKIHQSPLLRDPELQFATFQELNLLKEKLRVSKQASLI